jgi:hypothetical protein
MERAVPTDDVIDIPLPRGHLRWWSPAPAVYCTVVTGHFCKAGVGPILQGFADVVARHPGQLVDTFHDWSGLTGYDSDARVAYVEQARPQMPQVGIIEALVTSRIVAMGFEVARIALGTRLKGISDRAAFEAHRQAAIDAALRRKV